MSPRGVFSPVVTIKDIEDARMHGTGRGQATATRHVSLFPFFLLVTNSVTKTDSDIFSGNQSINQSMQQEIG
jgi:hypothetical protein